MYCMPSKFQSQNSTGKLKTVWEMDGLEDETENNAYFIANERGK